MLTQYKVISGAKTSARTLENYQLSAKRRICFVCRKSRRNCVYLQRLGVCGDCLNAHIWTGEQRRYEAFIISQGANR